MAEPIRQLAQLVSFSVEWVHADFSTPRKQRDRRILACAPPRVARGFLIDISSRDGYQYQQFRSAPMSRLVVQGEQDGGREILLRPGINVLGRSNDTDHQINDPTVSSFHCEIELQDGAMVVKDLGSTNGTFINSIPVQQSVLQPGQSLRLGCVEMIYSPQQPPAAPIAPPAVSKPTCCLDP